MDDVLIQARDLRKTYGSLEAVRGISFEVRRGECVGFLGPNGAGKTTTMRMVACALHRSAGVLRVFGMDPSIDGRRIKAQLGVVPQEDNLDTRISVLENLLLYGRYHGMPKARRESRARELLDLFLLSSRAREPVQNLSGGMRRRLLLARGLIHEPELLLLDEPTTGLDPQSRHVIWDKLLFLKKRGTTPCLTTHYMEEAEFLCDRVHIMEGGRIVASGSPRELIRQLPGKEVVEFFGPRVARDRVQEKLGPLVRSWEHLEDRSLAMTGDGERVVQRVAALIRQEGVEVRIRRATLEDVFLHLTGRRLVEGEG
jgi:lipooligosaccharide transport system ATP-binding protein